jgi:CRISPR-associated protein Cmr2
MTIVSTQTILHFSLGPVQAFVGQARRTRDLWAGSFLLSWLAGQAMRAIERGEFGTIDVPDIGTDVLYRALSGQGGNPRVGSLPNRFRAVIVGDGNAAGEAARQAIQQKWTALADLVWDTFIKEAAVHGGPTGGGTKAIWDRQIAHLWDMVWVVGESQSAAEDVAWLDARKNWRTWSPPPEPGDHCMLMGDWQEISGFVRARAGERKQQDEFWRTVRETVAERVYGTATTIELGETERLCAPALVKRLFPVLFAQRIGAAAKATEIIGFVPCGPVEPQHQADTVRTWRSTAHISATPWLRRIVREYEDQCDKYVDKVKNLADANGARGVIIAERGHALPGIPHEIGELDGRLFYEDSLLQKDSRSWGRPLNDPDQGMALRRQLAQHLAELQRDTGPRGLGRQLKAATKASPFFAILLMDGDNMGKLIGSGTKVSDALANFAKAAAAHRGDHVTIYAGGDDYLGLFPLPDVIDAAMALRRSYLDAFRGRVSEEAVVAASISAAIIFAPYDGPLTQLIREGHRLLDEVAKDANGRDSLAVSVLKSSGEMATWVSKWGDGEQNAAALAALATNMAEDPEHSSSYIYKLDRLYGDYYRGRNLKENEKQRLEKILLAERLVGRDINETKLDEAKGQRDAVLAACLTKGTRGSTSFERFSLAGAFIARFLADNGFVERERGPRIQEKAA